MSKLKYAQFVSHGEPISTHTSMSKEAADKLSGGITLAEIEKMLNTLSNPREANTLSNPREANIKDVECEVIEPKRLDAPK